MTVVNEMLSAGKELCADLGLPKVSSIEPLSGGKNNQIYKLKSVGGEQFVLKKYNSHPDDPRDRLGAEWGFLRAIWDGGIRKTPEPLAFSRKKNLALYTFINGTKVTKVNISTEHINQAAQFIIDINSKAVKFDKLPPASEACFSLEDHVEIIDNRVKRLLHLDDNAPLYEDANNFVIDKLLPTWSELYLSIREFMNAGSLTEPSTEWISPSDFGFHNALMDVHGAVKFIDFEYAGRDDLAKLVNDFFCCPEIEVPISLRPIFINMIVRDLQLPVSFIKRCELLFRAYKIKWICIILNDFLKVGSSRRDFAGLGNREERCRIQLSKAHEKFIEIQSLNKWSAYDGI